MSLYNIKTIIKTNNKTIILLKYWTDFRDRILVLTQLDNSNSLVNLPWPSKHLLVQGQQKK